MSYGQLLKGGGLAFASAGTLAMYRKLKFEPSNGSQTICADSLRQRAQNHRRAEFEDGNNQEEYNRTRSVVLFCGFEAIAGCLSRAWRHAVRCRSARPRLPPPLLFGLASFARILLLLPHVAIILLGQVISFAAPDLRDEYGGSAWMLIPRILRFLSRTAKRGCATIFRTSGCA